MGRDRAEKSSGPRNWWRSRAGDVGAATAVLALLAVATTPPGSAAAAVAAGRHGATAAGATTAPSQSTCGRGTRLGGLVSVAPIGEQSRSQVVAAARAQGFTGTDAELDKVVRHGVARYRVVYRTRTPDNRPTTASGLLVLPRLTVTHNAPLPTVIHTHGSMTARDRAPSVNPEGPDHVASTVYAAGGRIALAPDYLGLGLGPGRHPFMDVASTVSASLDLLCASPIALRQIAAGYDSRPGIAPDGGVYVTGFSQGGQAAMGVGQALSGGAVRSFRLRGLAAVGGEYDLEHVEIPALFDGRINATAGVIAAAYFLTAQRHLSTPPLCTDPAAVFRPPYAAYVEDLFDGEHSQEEVVKKLPGTLNELVTERWYDYLRHPTGPLLDALRRNSTSCAWTPRVPVTLHTSAGDREAPRDNTLSCARQLAEHGRTARVVDHGSVDHTGAFQHAVIPIARGFPTPTVG
ncbi:alpha/beta hydrolase family protein [Streptomyces sp. S186]|uniref:alpha/beta hydrolase family protein n=1 Tax=Streptomyces sp. S186 TaxID=3434395 RepID=UPI003F67F5A3